MLKSKIQGIFVTAGIKKDIPKEIQDFIFSIYNLTPVPIDYIQVFKLNEVKTDNTIFQRIEQSQEIPEFKREYMIVTDKAINAKIYIIDDGDNIVMMLAEEY